MTLLDESEIERIANEFKEQLNTETQVSVEVEYEPEPQPELPRYRWITPFAEAADELIDICTSTEGRWLFGIQPLDDVLRGIGRGQLCYLTAKAHCFDDQTTILTDRGWLGPDEIKVGDRTWGVDPETGESRWGNVLEVIDKHYSGKMLSLEGKTHSSLTTPEHRWFVSSQWAVEHGDRSLKLRRSEELNTSDYVPVARPAADGTGDLLDDEVRLLGWVSTDGWFNYAGRGASICQSPSANPDKCEMIEKMLANLGIQPAKSFNKNTGLQVWSIAHERGAWVREMLPNKRITPALLARLTQGQRMILIETLRLADGYMATDVTERLVTTYPEIADAYSLLLAQAGVAYTLVKRDTDQVYNGYHCTKPMYVFTLGQRDHSRIARQKRGWVDYDGRVWCVHTDLGTVFAKRGKSTYYSGQSGKTALVLTSLVNKPNSRVILFTPDEVRVEVLAKLVSMVRGIDGEQLEKRIRKGDSAAIDAVYRTATHDFSNLVVIDETLDFDQMEVALREAEDFWGAPADMVAVDYLELLGDGDSDGIAGLSKEMKRWTKKVNRPVICLRQNSRTSSKRGQAAGMEGMSYAGQNEAIYVLEVFRKGDDESLPEADRDLLRDSITVNVAKNKRPPCKRGMFDLHMDPATGIVRVPVAGDSTYRKPLQQSAPKAALAQYYALKDVD